MEIIICPYCGKDQTLEGLTQSNASIWHTWECEDCGRDYLVKYSIEIWLDVKKTEEQE